MAAEAPARPAPASARRHIRPARLHAERASARLALRQIWWGALVVAAWTGVMLWFGLIAFSKAHKLAGGVSMAGLAGNPAFRAIYGLPTAVNTVGGFTVWRVQIFIVVIATVWAALAVTGVLRGNEEAGRFDLILATPLSLGRATSTHLLAMLAAPLLAAVVAGTALQAGGAPPGGSWLWAAGLGLLIATFVGVGALTSQIVPDRRRAGGLAAAVLLATFVLRMFADGQNNAGWVRWTTPFGWLEELRAFGGNDLIPLAPLIAAPLVLGLLAVGLSRRRDTGAGLLRAADTAHAGTRLLTSPLAFATRRRSRGIIGWALGVAVLGLLAGGLSQSFVSFKASPAYVQLLDKFGMGAAVTPAGFLAIMDVMVAVLLAAYAVVTIHGDYSDEVAARLDLPYSTRATRTRWASSTVATGAAAMIVLTVVLALTTWAGSAAAGAHLSAGDCFSAAANALPAAAVFLGLAMLLHGIWPSWTAGVAGGLAVGLYMIGLIGPGLSWPSWLINLSPFHQTELVPAVSPNWTAIGVMLAIAVAAAGVGLFAYARRDLR